LQAKSRAGAPFGQLSAIGLDDAVYFQTVGKDDRWTGWSLVNDGKVKALSANLDSKGSPSALCDRPG
jgi:hypothetical protein